MAAQLCSYCAQIPFGAFRLPLVSEVNSNQNTKNKQSRSGFFEKDQNILHKSPVLGTFSHILRNEAQCRLCEIFSKMLRTLDHSPVYGKSLDEITGDLDMTCRLVGHQVYALSMTNHLILQPSLVWGELIAHGPSGVWNCLQTSDQPIQRGNSSNPEENQLYLRGRIRPLEIDTDLVKSWLNICRTQHGAPCAQMLKTDRQLADIRLVDVEKGCIVSFDQVQILSVEYAAISYVWGGKDHKLDLRTSNQHQLKEPGSIRPAGLSLTLADYVTLVSKLGIRYAWADALCVLQDSDNDKSEQISMMSAIYQGAVLTIINGAGRTLDSGLPGVRPGTRFVQQEEITVPLTQNERKGAGPPKTMKFMTSLTPGMKSDSSVLDETKWVSRSWTYQERLLSRRVLFFTSEQIFWSCRATSFCEENHQEYNQELVVPNPPDVTRDVGFLGASKSMQRYHQVSALDMKLLSYRSYVQSFSKRELTYSGDIHNSFAGILQSMARALECDIIWGLPTSRFNHSLAWNNSFSRSSLVRRLDKSTLRMPPKDVHIEFPSWSWMGWDGSIDMNMTEEWEAEGNLPTIDCFLHTTNPIRLVRATSYAERQSPVSAYSQDDDDSDNDQEITLEDIRQQYPQLNIATLENIPDSTLIIFWAEVVRLQVHYIRRAEDVPPNDEELFWRPGYAHITTTMGKKIGQLDPITPSTSTPSTQSPSPFINTAQKDDEYEFVAIGRQVQDEEIAAFLGDGGRTRVIVLQLSKRQSIEDRGLPDERLSCGWVYEDVWMEALRDQSRDRARNGGGGRRLVVMK